MLSCAVRCCVCDMKQAIRIWFLFCENVEKIIYFFSCASSMGRVHLVNFAITGFTDWLQRKSTFVVNASMTLMVALVEATTDDRHRPMQLKYIFCASQKCVHYYCPSSRNSASATRNSTIRNVCALCLLVSYFQPFFLRYCFSSSVIDGRCARFARGLPFRSQLLLFSFRPQFHGRKSYIHIRQGKSIASILWMIAFVFLFVSLFFFFLSHLLRLQSCVCAVHGLCLMRKHLRFEWFFFIWFFSTFLWNELVRGAWFSCAFDPFDWQTEREMRRKWK